MNLQGFVWTGLSEVVYITAKGIEQYQVRVSEKCTYWTDESPGFCVDRAQWSRLYNSQGNQMVPGKG